MSNIQPSNFTPPSEFELDMLRQEYFFLQTTIEDYNKQIWVIKALGITGTGAVIALALQQKQGLIVLLGSAIPVFFWVLESQWKHFQRGFYPRVIEIEEILVKDCKLRSPAIFGEWCRSFKRNTVSKRKGYVWDGLLNPSVFISYVLEIVFLLLIWRFVPFT
ncbi:hypothetical protein CDG76_09720 [Nostoc sp. 'Peltigera membranacea cyanobiont' 210A]|uniref:hypothetical protein n=1 Tax=unclassified Nostoc TaxID=2593658 RepID=UPI000B95B58F|nr:hypothetical protein [Nostoc sp. 'Peltigera membranacea cyanobiont' 210A]OYD95816.1 hypothetical protein CDG76_09720 [Nostoc sp. 'Peltigera membranacea cyanobiont' 210A]